MISRLHIANYALIDSLNIEFTEGLNIITGETGAGKSIILGALGLLLGARADAKAIRRSDCKSVVEAIFNVEGLEALAAWAEENNLDWDARECILRREITPSGRSRAFVNDTPVNLTQLAELGSQLIDIHSQNQNRLLASPDYQLKIVDSIADNAALLGRYQSDYSAWRKAVRALDAAQKALEQNRADQEFIAFRLAQLDEAQLVAGEQEELENERELQSNMTDRSMRVHIIYLTCRHPRFAQGIVHGFITALSRGGRSRLMIGVVGVFSTRKISVRLFLQSVFALQHNITCTLSQIQSGTVGIKRTAGLFVQYHQRTESSKCKQTQRIGSSCHHPVGDTATNQPCRRQNGIGRR